MEISETTRRDILDGLAIEKAHWAGRLNDIDFLSRLYDLSKLPSTDRRYPDAGGDIWQHRVNNDDWDDDWVLRDDRFDLLHCPDEKLLSFLCETLHPVVRPDLTEVERLKQHYNDCLSRDGWEVVERARMASRPIFAARRLLDATLPGVAVAKKAVETLEADYVMIQINRMESAVIEDPALAIGTAKELVETCCKTILKERGVEITGSLELPKLVRLAAKELKLTPEDIPDEAKAVDTIRRLLSNLSTITNGLAELRNQYGTGHGRDAASKGLQPRHAKLAVGAASTLAVFLLETHKDRGS